MLFLDLIRLCRPQQWTKNALCVAGPVFTTADVTAAGWTAALLTLLAFSVLASAVYAINDTLDAEADRRSSRTASRPVAAGRVSPMQATALAAALLLAGLAVALQLPQATRLMLLFYIGLNVAYTGWLKHVVLLDVFCISLGFILRLLAGIYAIGDKPTAWIVLCTMFLTMFIGFAKRRSELAGCDASQDVRHRPALSGYSVDYLDFLVSATSTMAIVTYALFTTTGGRDPTLLLTVFPVVYGIFHYKRSVMIGSGTDTPDVVVLTDRVLWACVGIWLLSFLAIAHWSPGLLR